MAPMAPFLSEHLYQNLVVAVDASQPESVHLSDWPVADAALSDEDLLRDMNALVRIVELGRSARASSGRKTRQPLPEVLVRVRSDAELAGLKHLEAQLLEELNVKQVRYLDVHADFVDYAVKPNLPLIGKRVGKRIPELRQKLAQMDGKEIARNVREQKETVIRLGDEDMVFEPEAFLLDAKSPEGYSAVEERGYLAALNTSLTPELIKEGLMRDVVRSIQNARKNAGLEVSDRIAVGLSAGDTLTDAVSVHKQTVMNEVLADALDFAPLPDAQYEETVEIENEALSISLSRV